MMNLKKRLKNLEEHLMDTQWNGDPRKMTDAELKRCLCYYAGLPEGTEWTEAIMDRILCQLARLPVETELTDALRAKIYKLAEAISAEDALLTDALRAEIYKLAEARSDEDALPRS